MSYSISLSRTWRNTWCQRDRRCAAKLFSEVHAGQQAIMSTNWKRGGFLWIWHFKQEKSWWGEFCRIGSAVSIHGVFKIQQNKARCNPVWSRSWPMQEAELETSSEALSNLNDSLVPRKQVLCSGVPRPPKFLTQNTSWSQMTKATLLLTGNVRI